MLSKDDREMTNDGTFVNERPPVCASVFQPESRVSTGSSGASAAGRLCIREARVITACLTSPPD